MLDVIRESEQSPMLERDAQSSEFGDLLRRARLAAGLTQEELAEQAGLSTRGISDLERGARRTPRRDTVTLLAKALKLSEAERQEWLRARHLSGADPPSFAVSPMQPTTLIGREREYGLLSDALERAIAGQGQAIMLSGEPGIGKTRLAEELSSLARSRSVCPLWGRCYQGTGAPAYWPWIQVLRELVTRHDRNHLRYLMGSGASDLAHVLPELSDWWPDLPPSALEGESARFRLFDSMTTFLRDFAIDQPLLIVIDDLQWADHSSLLLLEFLSRVIRDGRLLLVGLYRDTEVDRDQPLTSAILEIIRQPANQHLALHGLGEHDVQAMIEHPTIEHLTNEADTPGLASWVTERSAGNPFFVTEILRFLETSINSSMEAGDPQLRFTIPTRVRELIRQRLDRLSDECQHALENGAVIGREFDLRLLGEVSQVPADRLIDLLDQAAQARIIRAQTGVAVSHRFVHDLIRETVYDDLRPSRRVQLHEQVGLALERIYGTEMSPHYSRAAHHFVQAAPIAGHEHAVRYLIKAGEQSMAYVAYDNAAEHYATAVELLEHYGQLDGERGADLVLDLGEALRRAGRIPAARETFQRAAEVARRHNLPRHLASAALGFSGGIVLSGRDDLAAQKLLRDASRALGPEDSAIKAQCLARAALAFSGFHDEELPEWRRLSTEAVAIARRVRDPEALATALHARHREIWGASESNLSEGMSVAAEMVEVARASGNPELIFTGLCWQMFEPLTLGDTPTVDRLFAECQRLASELRQPFYTFMIASLGAMRAVVAGELSEAEELTEQSRVIAQEVGIPQDYDVFWWWLLQFQICRERDRFAEVDAFARDRLKEVSSYILVNRVVSSQLALLHSTESVNPPSSSVPADNANLVSEIESALAVVIADDKYGSKSHKLYSLVHLAEAVAILGDADTGRGLYDLLEPDAGFVATVGGSFMCVGSIAHYCGLLATTLSRWEDAERHFADALEMNERIGARAFSARTRFAWADMLLRRGRPADRERARDLLDEAEHLADEMGMIALSRQTAELRRR